MLDTALPPILGERPRILILGSMPGQDSLKTQRYYAHPQNSFWWIMSEVYKFEPSLDYSKRCAALIKAGVAVWDVLHQCRRQGSLDSAIERETEVANDFTAFFEAQLSIKSVLFNGATSLKLFKRHCAAELENQSIKIFQVPSTSPAYAAMSRQRKLEIWRQSLQESL